MDTPKEGDPGFSPPPGNGYNKKDPLKKASFSLAYPMDSHDQEKNLTLSGIFND